MPNIATIAATAVGISVALTWLIRSIAPGIGLVDRPDGRRKLHGRTIPLGGGVAVLGAFALTTAGLIGLPFAQGETWRLTGNSVTGLIGSAVFLCLVGLWDDRVGLRGRQKLIGQVVAAGILMQSGLMIRTVSLAGWQIELGLLAVPLTMCWLLGAVNAFNLIDGMDGLAASVGIVISLSLACMAWLTGHESDALLALMLFGSLVGFLVFNRPPATIFLGDAGSMVIGLLLGALAIRSTLKGPATVAIAAPIAIWAIPFLDVGMAILRRKLTGRSIYTTDRGHLHHCLLRRGFSGLHTVYLIALLCSVTTAGALVSVYRNNELLAAGSVVSVVLVLVTSRFFGHSECVLLGRRLRYFILSLIPSQWQRDRDAKGLRIQLQGTREWDCLWQTLLDIADQFRLRSVQLNLNLPAINEEFHARWDRGSNSQGEEWESEIPLIVGLQAVGRLRIAGACVEGFQSAWMAKLLSALEPFETQLMAMLEEHPQWRPMTVAAVSGGISGRNVAAIPATHSVVGHPAALAR